jgi:hypothetical protein
MALLFWDGWDSYNSINDINSIRPEVNPLSNVWIRNLPTLQSTGGRFDGKNFSSGEFGIGLVTLSDSPTEIYFGQAVKLVYGGDIFMHVFEEAPGDGGPASICLEATPAAELKVWRGNGYNGGAGSSKTQIDITEPGVFSYSAWHWFEVRVKMSSSAATPDGVFELWIDNKKVINNQACVTKYANTSTSYNSVGIWITGSRGGRTDDVYVTDTNGPAPWNSRLGDIRIALLSPNSDAGPNQGVPSTGNTHYGVVDEMPFSGDDWVSISANASGNGEMFGHTTISNSAYVLGVTVTAMASKSDAGNATIQLSLQTEANTYNSNTFFLSTSNNVYRHTWYENPEKGSQWSVSDWNAANVGVYIV